MTLSLRAAVAGALLVGLLPTRVGAQCPLVGAALDISAVVKQLVELDKTSGAVVRVIGTLAAPLDALAQHPGTGVLDGVTFENGPKRLMTINPTTGEETLVGSLGALTGDGGVISDIAFRSDGALFGWYSGGSSSNPALVTINTTTGAATVVGSATGIYNSGLAFSPSGALLLVSHFGEPLRYVDPNTGSTNDGPTASIPSGFTSLAFGPVGAMKFDPATGTLFAVNTGSVDMVPTRFGTIDPSTGAVTYLGFPPQHTYAIAFLCGTTAPRPTITQQPSNVTVTAGDVAFFTAGASGASSVQWQVSANSGGSWSNVSGATGTTHGLYTTAADNGKWFRAVFINAAGSTPTIAAVLTVNLPPGQPLGDFSGDGKPDLVWQHPNTGAVLLWKMDGPTMIGGSYISQGGTTWEVVGTADFTGDGKPDVLWQQPSTGAVLLWRMNGDAYVSGVMISPGSTLWKVVATGDFTGDGKADIVWQHPMTGAVLLWQMNGESFVTGFMLNSGGTLWQVVGAADFNGDGNTDLLWQDPSTGALLVWEMNGVTNIGGTIVSAGGTLWKVTGVGDYNGDGKVDIVWQHPNTGGVLIWFMDRESYAFGTLVLDGGTLWKLKGPR